MFWYNELNTKKGELFIFRNGEEAVELIHELISQKIQFSYDQNDYTGETFITILGGNVK